MTENPWDQWLRNWLNRNPLREPPEELQRDYVRQVMERIRPDPAPAREPMWRRWMQPRLAPLDNPRLRPTGLALAGALAAAAVAVAVYRGPGIADPLERDSQILLEAGELALLNGDGTALEEALEEQDRIVLAEAVEQEKWGPDFVQDSELPEDLEEVADEELLQEIRTADEREMSLS